MSTLDLSARVQSISTVLHPFIFNEFRAWFALRGGDIAATDMKQYPESQPLYAQANLFGTFDGATVYLHDNVGEIGGAHYSALDALHLGLHCVQMSLPQEIASRLGLVFDKEVSRREIYAGEADDGTDTLQRMVAYEAETHGMILGWVRSLGARLEARLQPIAVSTDAFVDVLRDFYAADLTYVEHVLKTNELPKLSAFIERLDGSGPERKRFEEIRSMIRPVDTTGITGRFLEQLPRGEIIFGVRGPKEPQRPVPAATNHLSCG